MLSVCSSSGSAAARNGSKLGDPQRSSETRLFDITQQVCGCVRIVPSFFPLQYSISFHFVDVEILLCFLLLLQVFFVNCKINTVRQEGGRHFLTVPHNCIQHETMFQCRCSVALNVEQRQQPLSTAPWDRGGAFTLQEGELTT